MSNAKFEPLVTLPTSVAGAVVEVSAVAVADPCVGAAPVAPGTVVPLIVDVNSRLIATVAGYTANDTPDCGNPVKTGGIAVLDNTVGQVPAVAVSDRVNSAYSINGQQLALVEGTQAHNDLIVATNRPVLVGGYGADEAPALVTVVGALVREYSDRAGRQEVNQEMAIAGENIPLNVLRVVRGKLIVEQESWDKYNSALGTRQTSQLVKTGAGRVAEVIATNGHTDPITCFVFDNTAASGTVLARFQVPAGTALADGTACLDLSMLDGDYFETGLTVALSTSSSAVSAPGTGGFFHVRFV